MKFSRIVCALSLAFGASLAAHAGPVTSQAQLAALLGAGEVMENFEGNGLLGAGQIVGSLLNSSATYGGYGPGLVQAGATYSAEFLFWNDNAYFDLNTRTLGDASGWRGLATRIAYTQPVNAFGFDMQGYVGYDMAGTVEVYDLSDALLVTANVNGGFFGWENAAGIGRVIISATSGYIMLDNHGYGSASSAVPEPASLGLVGVALLGLAGSIRKRRA